MSTINHPNHPQPAGLDPHRLHPTSAHNPSHGPHVDHDQHREAVIGLRLALGSILSPKRPGLSHSHSHPSTLSTSTTQSGTASPYPPGSFHSHHPHSTSTHSTPPGPSNNSNNAVNGPPPPTPAIPSTKPNPGLVNQVPPHSQAHLPTYPHATATATLNTHHLGPNSQSQSSPTYGFSKLSITHSPSSSPPLSSSPSPPSSPGPSTPPNLLPHHHHHAHSPLVPAGAGAANNAVDNDHLAPPPPILGSGSASGAVTPTNRARWLTTLQGKSAWDAMVHGSWM